MEIVSKERLIAMLQTEKAMEEQMRQTVGSLGEMTMAHHREAPAHFELEMERAEQIMVGREQAAQAEFIRLTLAA